VIICTQHPNKYIDSRCELQQRVAELLLEAQRDGDAVVLYLIDRDDPTHIAMATIGTDPAIARMVETQLALMEVSIRCRGEVGD
jgi:hypothetical protein